MIVSIGFLLSASPFVSRGRCISLASWYLATSTWCVPSPSSIMRKFGMICHSITTKVLLFNSFLMASFWYRTSLSALPCTIKDSKKKKKKQSYLLPLNQINVSEVFSKYSILMCNMVSIENWQQYTSERSKGIFQFLNYGPGIPANKIENQIILLLSCYDQPSITCK